ncbi:CehA/McbA family metallohydrolase [Salinilacihabitans rarus]|uniref:CehA/McbA family metallohydrolase n=1 Tax=Salinilacihabitans rarus TaxID=2961596 RepID=UPI0020C8ECDF|nr:CehA/McbA family metallohydrolase [Salinilacihabitans rarus]
MFAVDLHAHTRFFHGRRALGDLYDPVGFRLLAAAAGSRGLDAVATTNHDYYTPFPEPRALAALPGVDRVTPIPGIEITTTRGHVLVVGPDPPRETRPEALTPAEAVALAHDRDCAAIVAHPYRNSTVREVEDVPFDAIEVNGKHPRTREVVERLAAARDLPLVGGSDAHYPIEVGRAYTLVDADELTPEAVVDAIRDGAVEARIDRRWYHEGAQRLYRTIHGRKGWLDEVPAPTPGVGKPPGEGGA